MLRQPDEQLCENNSFLVYLGNLLSSDGRADSEVFRRIGAAAGDFKKLQKICGHAGISTKRQRGSLSFSMLYCAQIEVWSRFGVVGDGAEAAHGRLLCQLSQTRTRYPSGLHFSYLQQDRLRKGKCAAIRRTITVSAIGTCREGRKSSSR